MQTETGEFSFILKPSSIQGVGVFAAHGIAKGTKLKVFADDHTYRILDEETVPEGFDSLCLGLGDGKLGCPNDFNHMSIGWYLNHSKEPNAYFDENYLLFAARDIAAGEELTIDYKLFDEPGDQKENYY